MGLFGGSTKVIVGSSSYNLAGELSKRPNYLKTTVVGAVLSEGQHFTPQFMNSYLSGPGIKLKRFDNWAKKGGSYNEFIGNNSMVLLLGSGVNNTALATYLAGNYRQVKVTRSFVGPPDVSYWALQHLLTYYPTYAETAWRVETKVRSFFVSDPDGNLTEQFEQYPPNAYLITIPNLPGKINFTAPQVPDGTYLYYEYIESPLSTESAAVYDPWMAGSTDPNYLPSDNRWTMLENTQTDYGGWFRHFTRKGVDLPSVNKSVQYQQDYMYQSKTVTRSVVNGQIVETTIYNYRLGRSVVTLAKWSGRKLAIYRYGSGTPTLDALMDSREQTKSGTFLPIIPVRRDNLMVDATQYPLAYSWASKALKKATGGKLSELHKSLWDNPDLKQIDNAYVVFGIGLNAKDQDSKQYLYDFFRSISLESGFTGVPSVDSVLNQIALENIRMQEWIAWLNNSSGTRPIQPPFPSYTPLPEVGFRVTTTGSVLDWGYDSRISWNGARILSGSGIRVPGSKVGDYNIIKDGQESYNIWVMPGGDSTQPVQQTLFVPRTLLVYQRTATIWDAVLIWDLKHTNTIYKDRSVVTTAWAALDKVEDTSFIVPITMNSLKASGLIKSTQIAMSCSHLVVNYYDEQKIPWYASGFFQIIVIVVIIVVAVYTGGAGASAGGGVLGTNVAVGTALGFAGTAAIVAGAVANAFAGMIVATLIQKGSTALFGDKIGQIVGFIATAYTMNLLSGGPSLTVTMESVMAKLRDPGTWLQLTDAVTGHLQSEVKDIATKQQSFLEDYQAKMDEITGLKNQLGNTGVDLLSALTNATNIVLESPEQFLGRTLLTGDEIAAATIKMVENFPAAELRLPLS